MSLTDKDREIAYAIVLHLQSQVDSQRLRDEQNEGVSVAIQCLSEAYGVELGDKNQKYQGSKTLEELFGDLKVLTDEDKAKADAIKQEGNVQLKLNNFQGAVSLYSDAIEIDSNNATFYCNRAAAYIKLEDYQNALTDCKKAIEIDPEYARAHGRMGYIYSVINKFPEAKESFAKAIHLDPSNGSYKGNLDAVQEQLKASEQSQGGGAVPGMGDAPGSGIPVMPPGLGGMLGGGGLANLFQNPGFMNMATSMMQNPAFQNMAGRMMQQGRAAPQNMTEMMPEMVQAARQMQEENPEMFETLRQQATQFSPEGEGELPPGDNTKDSDAKEQ